MTGASAFDGSADWQPFEPQPVEPASDEAEDRPGLPAFPGAQPWEVAGDDGAQYDWFADPQGPPRPMRGRLPRNLGAQPGTPSPSPRPPGGPQSAGPGAPRQPAAPAPGAQPIAPQPGAQPLSQPGASLPGAQPPSLPGAQPPSQAAEPEPDPQTPGQSGVSWSSTSGPWPAPIPEEPATWAVDPVVPGAPAWEPPPAFTAAAAGMQVWPAPVSDPPVMPWPAATGELAVELDADDAADQMSSWNVPSESSDDPPDDAPTYPGGIIPPVTSGDSPSGAKSSVYGGPTTKGPAFGESAPDYDEADPSEDDAEDFETDPNLTAPHPFDARGASSRPFAARDAAQSGFDANITDPDFGANTTAPGFDATTPVASTPTTPAPAFDPNSRAHAFDTGPAPSASDPHSASAAHPVEPSDVPVWPPLPHGVPEQESRVPDLPFEVWGQKPTPALPPGSQERGSTPPQGLPVAYGGQGPFKQSPFQATAPVGSPPGKPAGRKALFITLGILALAGVATGGFFAYKSVSAPSPPTATAVAKQPPTTPPSIVSTDTTTTPVVPATSILNSEETDPRKMSLSEAFPQKKIEANGAVFSKVKTDMTASCEKAASGPFADALRDQKCSRIVRATYVDSKRRYAVTTGIAVLPTKEAAMSADKAKNLGRNIWFRGLPAAEGTGGERVEIAGGYAAGLVWGRYIVFSYATYADGHTPGTKEKTLDKVSGAFRDQTSQVLERRLTND
ncbi:hypothetical protein [Nonomuraea guangzhouensis]|uniref:Uncharacterized protein n=1 Tax=Nonomuraea guangzhouensis TaxID=1291555 RepID=A0ABW4GIC0_9ACTN|nr:hypothetical protein [Nonomuraea guangzhouensis]